RRGRRQRLFLVETDEGVHLGLPGLDPSETRLRRFDRADAPGSNGVGNFREVLQRQIGHRAAASSARAKWAGSSANRSVLTSRRTAVLSRETSAASSAARESSTRW